MSKIKKVVYGILLCIALMLLLIVLGIYVSYNTLKINDFTLHSSKIDTPLTMVVLADLHDYEFGSNNQKLVDQVAKQQPDAILMVGDFINKYSKDTDVLLELTEQLVEIAPVYFSWGNHELGYVELHAEADLITFEKQLSDAGVVVLDKRYQDVEIAGQTIRIGGLYD